MRGTVRVHVGGYALSADVTLDILLSDGGVHLSLEDRHVGHIYMTTISPDGKNTGTVFREMGNSRVARPARRVLGQKRSDKLPVGRRTLLPSTPIKFYIQYGRTKRPRNTARVIGAFTDFTDLHILYRVTGGDIVYYENQLAVTRAHVAIGDRMPQEHRLPDNRWDEILTLKDGEKFTLAREWTKMPLDQIEAVIGGRTFQITKPQD